MKSKSIWKLGPPSCGIGEVVRPRHVTYSGTCHQWLVIGALARRILPTPCIQSCKVAQVSFHSSKGSAGQVWMSVTSATSRSHFTPIGRRVRRPTHAPFCSGHIDKDDFGVLDRGYAQRPLVLDGGAVARREANAVDLDCAESRDDIGPAA